MTRLAHIPRHLLPPSEQQPIKAVTVQTHTVEVSEAAMWELMSLRAALSLCAGRITPTRESIMGECERVEAVIAGLREVAKRL